MAILTAQRREEKWKQSHKAHTVRWLNQPAIKLLFICSRNEWRSRTAEEIFKNLPGYAVKSVGTEPSARIRVTEGLIGWADVIFVMERKHRSILQERFRNVILDRPIHCLDIPDDYTSWIPTSSPRWKASSRRTSNQTNNDTHRHIRNGRPLLFIRHNQRRCARRALRRTRPPGRRLYVGSDLEIVDGDPCAEMLSALQIGAEADNFFAYAESREPLQRAAELLQAAATDPNLLLSAIEHAGDDIE